MKRKTRVKRTKIFLVVLFCIALIVAVSSACSNFAAPTVETKLAYEANAYTTQIISQTVLEELERMDITYPQIIRVTRNGFGTITSLQADSVLLNKIKSVITVSGGDKMYKSGA